MNKLSDFEPEVLRSMLGAVIYKSEELKNHIARIESHGKDMRKLMAGELINLRKEICTLETAEIQISTALASQEMDRKALLN